MSTTEAENKELVRQFANEVWNEGNLGVIEEKVADDYVDHGLEGDRQGREAFQAYASAAQAAFPDLQLTIEDLIAEENKVVRRSRLTGTHEGEFMGIDPTGNSVDVGAMVIYRIEDGRIVETWDQADMQGMMDQLGVVEPPGE